MNNADKPIYPSTELIKSEVLGHELTSKRSHKGLTKREYFAGLTLQGLLSSRKDPLYQISDATLDTFAKTSVKLANKLLKQLETKD